MSCLPNIKAWRGSRPIDPMFNNWNNIKTDSDFAQDLFWMKLIPAYIVRLTKSEGYPQFLNWTSILAYIMCICRQIYKYKHIKLLITSKKFCSVWNNCTVCPFCPVFPVCPVYPLFPVWPVRCFSPYVTLPSLTLCMNTLFFFDCLVHKGKVKKYGNIKWHLPWRGRGGLACH